MYWNLIEKSKRIKGVMTLLGGDPDFNTPKHIRDAATKALEDGWTHYPSIGGISELKEALAKYHKRYGTNWNSSDEVIVTAGALPALYLSLLGTLSRGDEVVLFEPFYMGYKPLIDYLGCTGITVKLREEKGYHFEMEELYESVTSKTRMILICSPNNPTGTVFTEKELSGIAELAQEKDLFILSDEIYDQFIWDDLKHHSIASQSGMKEKTLVITSFSKTFSMTGWRLGSIMADKSIISSLRKIPLGGRPATFIQKAGVAALKGPWDPIIEFRREYNKRKKYLSKRLNEIEGISCTNPEGAFYLFPNLKATGQKAVDLCEGLLEKQKFATVPGTEFGDAGEYHVRLPLVKPIEYLTKCADAMEDYIKHI